MKLSLIHPLVRLFIFGFVLFALNSCSPKYIPNVVNTPMFDEEGELQANLYGGVSGTDVQLAYALTDNIGIMANGSFLNRTGDTTDSFHKHTLYESGVGYFGQIGKIGRYEIFGGLGTGRIGDYDSSKDDFIDRSRFIKVFIQPSYGLKTDIFDGSLSTRWVLINANYNAGQGEEESGFQPFIEPVITGRLGFKYIKFVAQFGLSIPIKEDYPFDVQPFIYSLGLHFNINVLGSK